MANTMMSASNYIDLPYRIEIEPAQLEDGSWVYMASHPEVAGAMSQGSTPEDGVRLLREARQLVIERHLEHGLDVPLPAAMQVTQ